VPYQAIEVFRLVGLVVALVSVGQSKTSAGCLQRTNIVKCRDRFNQYGLEML
jgi:hypothetical protein